MRHSTKIFLAGLGLSALVLAVGYMNTLRLEQRLSAARAECQRPASSNTSAHGPWEKYTAHGPDGTVVPLPHKLDEATGKQLRAELDEQEEFEFRLRAEREAAATSPIEPPMAPEASARTAGVDKKAAGRFVPDPPAKWALECEPNKLVSISAHDFLDGNVNLDNTGKLGGIQANVVDVDRAVRNSRSWPLPVALALFGLSAMPWLWYALLRRIGELRAAIGGNPPEA